MDLIVRHSTLPDGRIDLDIGVEGGRVVAVESRLAASASEEIDAAGNLVAPPFVDAHFHMDATLSYGLPRALDYVRGATPYLPLTVTRDQSSPNQSRRRASTLGPVSDD